MSGKPWAVLVYVVFVLNESGMVCEVCELHACDYSIDDSAQFICVGCEVCYCRCNTLPVTSLDNLIVWLDVVFALTLNRSASLRWDIHTLEVVVLLTLIESLCMGECESDELGYVKEDMEVAMEEVIRFLFAFTFTFAFAFVVDDADCECSWEIAGTTPMRSVAVRCNNRCRSILYACSSTFAKLLRK